MLYYVLKRTEERVIHAEEFDGDMQLLTRKEEEPIALIRVNATVQGDMIIMMPMKTRFGWMAPVHRSGQHVYNLIIGDNEEVLKALQSTMQYKLEQVKQAEWESFEAFELFPTLKLGMAR